MSSRDIKPHIRDQIEKRAKFRCEYCQTTMDVSTQRYEIEHITPISQGGEAKIDNLALACRGCNSHKFTATEGYDEISKLVVRLFHPRKDHWHQHFAWDINPVYIKGLTAIGRATINRLKLNRPQLIKVRTILLNISRHPPI
jgi:5-methylcytosine-specific restriction endonuclease McrA